MVIGIDIRLLARNTRTGIEEYTINLLEHLLPFDRSIKYKLFYNAYRKADLDYDWAHLSNVRVVSFSIPNKLLDLSSLLLRTPKIDKLLKGVDVFFSPHFIICGISRRMKRIITFHDLSFEHYGDFFQFSKKYWHFSMSPRSQAESAERIISVSESTKKDLVSIYNIPEEKVSVIYSGVGDNFRPIDKKNVKLAKVKKKYSLPDKFVLFLGTLEPRKNIEGLIKAFNKLKGKSGSGDLKLVIAGIKGWSYNSIFQEYEDAPSKRDIVFIGYVETDDKHYLYNLAELFIYPSFFEGFGFPPLEAMACGVPVIASNNSSMPEVIGNAGIMVDPYNIDEISRAMSEILNDRNLKKRLVLLGAEQARRFSWRRCAEETLKILVQ